MATPNKFNPQIRAMSLDDIADVYAIEEAVHRTPWTRNILRDCLLTGYSCLVLEQKNLLKPQINQVVGYIIYRYNLNICHILNLAIAPSYQHQGLGRFFLKTVIESFKDIDVQEIVLEVRTTNLSAISLYESLGFKKEAIKKGYYQDATSEEDAFLFKKIIKGLNSG